MICGRDEAMNKTIDGIYVRRLAIPYHNEISKRERIVSFFSSLVRASAVAARVPADMIYASSTLLTVAVPGIMAEFTQRAPLVAEIHDLWPEVPIKLGYPDNPVAISPAKQLEKAFYAASNEVVALSPSATDDVKRMAPKKRVTMIPSASDSEYSDIPVEQRATFCKEQGWDDDIVAVCTGGSDMSYQLE